MNPKSDQAGSVQFLRTPPPEPPVSRSNPYFCEIENIFEVIPDSSSYPRLNYHSTLTIQERAKSAGANSLNWEI